MKLSLKLAVLITLLAILSSGLVSVLSYTKIIDRVERRVAHSLESLVDTVSSMASTSAYVADQGLGQEVINGLELNAEIACAEIILNDKKRFASQLCEGQAAIDRALVSPWDAGEPVGQIRVYKSKQHVEDLVSEQLANEISAIIKVILIISASILLAAHLIVTRPIATVSRKLENIDFDDDVHLLSEGSRTDEVGSISRIINWMIVKAKKQIIYEKMSAHKTEELTNHFRLIFQLSKNSLAVTDEKLNLKSFNPTFKRTVSKAQPNLDLSFEDSWIDSVTDRPNELRTKVSSVQDLERPTTIEVSKKYYAGEYIESVYYSLTFVKSNSEDAGITILFFIYDITEHREQLEKTEYEANHDNLTGLYNRRAATRKVRHMLSSKPREESVAVLFVDLDGFKLVNDEHGHDTGDIVLKEVGQRISESIRRSDVACRWGGDEFLIALNDISLAEATSIANKILAAIIAPIDIDEENKCTIGASIGVTLSTPEISDFQTLYDHADKAMYRVKKSGKNSVLLHPL